MENTPDFILIWDRYMAFGAYGCAALALIILIYHEFRIFQIKDYKEKYDYVNLHEISYFWYAVIMIILASALYANSLSSSMVFGSALTWFYVRLFITVSFIIVAYFIFYSLVRIYYPRYVEKKLSKLRDKTRISSTGSPMRKLRADEEESHLEATKLTEQKEIHSVDYDIWIDEKTGEKKVEKYNAYQHAEECAECGYVTLKIDREELVEAPGSESTGILIKHYKCSYCSHREAKEVLVSSLSHNKV